MQSLWPMGSPCWGPFWEGAGPRRPTRTCRKSSSWCACGRRYPPTACAGFAKIYPPPRQAEMLFFFEGEGALVGGGWAMANAVAEYKGQWGWLHPLGRRCRLV